MNNKILSARETGHLACAWLATGDPKTPFVRVWSCSSNTAKAVVSPCV